MQSVLAFLVITKFTDFPWKNDNVSRTQGVCQVIHVFFGCSLGKVQLSQVQSLHDMCDRILEKGEGGRGLLFGQASVKKWDKNC